MEKLAEYEKIGLTPEQIQAVDNMYLEKCREVNELKKQLAKYEEKQPALEGGE